MDLLYLLYDRLVTSWLSIRPRRCKLPDPDGTRAYCRPSGRYRQKQRFRSVCQLADPATLNPLTLRECLCTEGPEAEATGAEGNEAVGESSEAQAASLQGGSVEGPEAGGQVIGDDRLAVEELKTACGPGDWITVEAVVRNTSKTALSYASLEVEYLGEERTVLAQNITVVGRLEVGEAKPVKLSKKVPGYRSARIRFRNVLSIG